MTAAIGIGIAIVGCFVGLAGWLAGRDKRISADAEWKGEVNAKLDIIVGTQKDVAAVTRIVNDHESRIRVLEAARKRGDSE